MTFETLREICAKCKMGMACWQCPTNKEYVQEHPYHKDDRTWKVPQPTNEKEI